LYSIARTPLKLTGEISAALIDSANVCVRSQVVWDTTVPHLPSLPIVSKKTKSNPIAKPSSDLLKASYNAGFADGRLEAIEESMDTVAALILKAEGMIANLGDNPDRALQENSNHTLRALHVAFASITGSIAGSEAFLALLEQSRQRLQRKAAALH
jgi:hypothetical protein